MCSPVAIAGQAWACAGVGRREGALEPLANLGSEVGEWLLGHGPKNTTGVARTGLSVRAAVPGPANVNGSR